MFLVVVACFIIGLMQTMNSNANMLCYSIVSFRAHPITSLSKEFSLKKSHSEKLILDRNEYWKHSLNLAELNF